MKKIKVLFTVMLASSFLAVGSLAQKDSVSTKTDEKISAEMLKKLDSKDLSEIIKQREKLEHEENLANLRFASENSSYNPNGFSITLWVLIIFAFLFSTFAIPLYFNYRKGKMKQQLIEKLLEKDKEIPAELIEQLLAGNSFTKALNDKMANGLKTEEEYTGIKTGMTLVTLGLGLGLFLFFRDHADNFWTVSFIPLFMGIGYLILHRINKSKKKEDNSEI